MEIDQLKTRARGARAWISKWWYRTGSHITVFTIAVVVIGALDRFDMIDLNADIETAPVVTLMTVK